MERVRLLAYQYVQPPPKPSWWLRSEFALRDARVATWVGAPCCLEAALRLAVGWCSR